MSKVSIVIVNFNTADITCECIESVVKHTKGVDYEIIVIDNNSRDDSLKKLKKYENTKLNFKLIANKKNYGFGYANNQGVKVSNPSSKYILFLNSDTKFISNTIKKMISILKGKKDVGVISCKLLNRDMSVQKNGGYFPTLVRVFSWMLIQDLPYVDKVIKPFHPKGENFYNDDKELDWVTGAFFMIRKEVVREVGVFDTDYFMYTEDTDYCYRIKKVGWKIFYTSLSSIIHYGGASGQSWSFVEKEFEGVKIFYKKHYPRWQLPILRFILKTGALLRFFSYTLMSNSVAANSYVKAFYQA